MDLGETFEFSGVFAPLKDAREFARVFVHPEFHTVSWPNEVDLDSDVLYSMVTGAPLPGGGEMPAWAKPATRRTAATPVARRTHAKPPRRRVAPAAAKSRKAPARRVRAG